MLKDFPLYTTIPVTSIAKAKSFYEDKLGLKAEGEMEDGIMFAAGKGTKVFLYQRSASKADHTLASFDVTDIEKAMDELTQKGITFEKYDTLNLKTDERGVATMGNIKSAWFKDQDGNILALTQM